MGNGISHPPTEILICNLELISEGIQGFCHSPKPADGQLVSKVSKELCVDHIGVL